MDILYNKDPNISGKKNYKLSGCITGNDMFVIMYTPVFERSD